MRCPACDHEAAQSAFGQPLCCPSCGAFYEKALALKLRKEQASQKESQEQKVGGSLKKIDSALRAAVEVVTPSSASGYVRKYKFYCPACWSVSDGKRHVPGSILIEIVLWCFFLVPGLIYSIWRHSASRKVCAQCGDSGLIPVDSPRARREMQSM